MVVAFLTLSVGSPDAFAQTDPAPGMASEQEGFFVTAPSKRLSSQQSKLYGVLANEETSANIRIVRVRPDLLVSKQRVPFNLTQNQQVVLERQTVKRHDSDFYTWIGQQDLRNNAVLVVRNGQVTGSIRRDGQLYAIKPLSEGLHALVTVDESKLPGDHPSMLNDRLNDGMESRHRGPSNDSAGTSAPPRSSALENDGAAGGPSSSVTSMATSPTLDVIVAYTPEADADVADIQALVQLAVEETNLSYANSGIETRIELVHLYATSTNSTDDMFVELEQFRTPGDGAFDEIHDLRETYGADIAKLIGAASSNYGFCGLASVIEARTAAEAFAITAHNCATGNYTFAHEIGHLQGARHHIESDQNLFPYAFGHGTTDVTGDFRTVMGLNEINCPGNVCTRVPYWSTPDPEGAYDGTVTGDASLSDNASVLDLTATRIASFKSPEPTAQPRFAASPQSVERTITPGATATETVTITNPGEQELYWRASTSGNVKRSGDPDGPVYDWTDISQSPTATQLTSAHAVSVELPFTFPFYDETYSTVVIGFNGMLYFEDSPSSAFDLGFYRNQSLPNRFGYNGFIAAFWSATFPPMDGFPQTGAIYTDMDDEGRMVVQWHEIANYFTDELYTFQAILSPDGNILLQYHTIEDPEANASVGAESPSGLEGVNAGYRIGVLSDSYIEDLPVDGSAIAIEDYDVVNVSPYEGRIPAGGSADIPLRFSAIGKTTGTYTRNLTFTTNEPGAASHTIPVSIDVTPMPDRALALDGTDDYMAADDVSASIAAGDAFTLEAWVRPSETPVADRQHTVLGFHEAGGNNRNVLFYNPPGVNGATYGEFLYYDDTEGSIYTRDAFPGGEWVHVAVTVDASDQGTLYVNGRREATFTTAVRPDASGLFSIGQDYDSGPTATDFFDGRVDEVRIWSVARTQAEIQEGMTTSLGESNDLSGAVGLEAYYRFEGNAVDATGAVTGTLSGNPTYASDVPVETATDRLIVRVDVATSNSAANGTSWTDAHSTLRDGLAGTGPKNQVWVAGGTYYPDQGANVTDDSPDESFTITGDQDGLQVYGGFAGTEAQVSERTPGSETILSGDIDQNDAAFAPLADSDGDPDTATQTDHIVGTNSFHVLFIDGGGSRRENVETNVTPATVLDGLTVTSGSAEQTDLGVGGGLFCDGAFSNNECSPRLNGIVFAGNRARYGGAIGVQADLFDGTSSIELTNTVFIGNEADGFFGSTAQGDGGAVRIRTSNGSPKITNATFAYNRSREAGGAIALGNNNLDTFAGNVTVTNSVFWGNDSPVGSQIAVQSEIPLTVTHTLLHDGIGGISKTNGASITDGGENRDADPLLVNASDPAGADGLFGTEDDGLQVQVGSPVLDAGDTAALPADTFDMDGDGDTTEPLPLDLSGAERVIDNDADASTPAVVDLGAYEAAEGTQLPVELADFEATASEETVTLSWRTLTETNNAGFDIERRIGESGAWTSLQRITGAGTTTEAQTYRFTDTALPYAADALTYRLRQVDVDGTESFSDAVTVTRSLMTWSFSAPTRTRRAHKPPSALPSRTAPKTYAWSCTTSSAAESSRCA